MEGVDSAVMNANGAVRDALYARLRRSPSVHSVPGSLPVLFFGDIFSAQIATLGINPSQQEYLDRFGHELTGHAPRFQTLASLAAPSHAALSDEQCERAISAMQGYFWPGKPVYHWFRSLERVIHGMGYSYTSTSTSHTVVHLDLIQEATAPTWSALEKQEPLEASALLMADLPFLRWQLETFPLRAVVCNGKTPLRHVCALLDQPVDVDATTRGHMGGLTWYAAHGHMAGRTIAILGWNIPLARPTGLTTSDKQELGRQAGVYLDNFETSSDDVGP